MRRTPQSTARPKARSSTLRIAGRTPRRGQLELLSSIGPDGIARELTWLSARAREPGPPVSGAQPSPHLSLPAHHEVRASDVVARRLYGNLVAAADRGPSDFAELLLVPGVGARTVLALAMVAEVLHGAPYRFSDPARFSFAHGGKDRHPFPVPLRVVNETIRVLKSAVRNAKLGHDQELGALRRLDQQARQLERHACGPSVEALIAQERARSPAYGGRSVFGWERAEGEGEPLPDPSGRLRSFRAR